MERKKLFGYLTGGAWILAALSTFLPYISAGISESGLGLLSMAIRYKKYIEYDGALITRTMVLLLITILYPFLADLVCGIGVLVQNYKGEVSKKGLFLGIGISSLVIRIVSPFGFVYACGQLLSELIGSSFFMEFGISAKTVRVFYKVLGIGYWFGLVFAAAAVVCCILLCVKKNKTSAKQRRQAEPAYGGVITILTGALTGGEIALADGQTIVVGRDGRLSNVVIDSPKISRRHCEICWNAEDNCYIVTDCSSNGTKLENGNKLLHGAPTRVEEGHYLNLGDGAGEILLGTIKTHHLN